ncbi:MAG: PorP/SprF family type IX secretion system membrane protein [Thermaurantimonas sp.]|uniref:PorP/SprF family type IX secretion system membrane protein n=1 Tax=Thermaurantimonas sp. TaxID=2681568 RepID=UPI003919A1BB
MSIRGKTLIQIIALISFLAGVKAQDAHFSQYYANPLYLNPAFAGVARCPKVHLNYRSQYPIGNVYQTFSASYDQYFDNLKGGIGFLVLRDEAGDGTLNTTEIGAIYSYHLQVSRTFSVLAGFQANFRQRTLEWGNFRFPDMIDPFYGFVKPTEEVGPDRVQNNHVDLAVGFIGYSKDFYIGVAGHHLTQPDESFFVESKLPFKLTIHSGANIPISRRRLYGEYQSVLIPNIVIQNQGSFWSFFGGLSFNYAAITGGLGLRHGNTNPDALVILLGLAPSEMPWRIGYSYDYTISKLTNALGGAHEISLMYQFACPKKVKKIEPLRCPKF